jgi:AcrR family transcriptional regulator
MAVLVRVNRCAERKWFEVRSHDNYRCCGAGRFGVPKRVDHQLRRDEVLAATWRVIASKGIDDVRLRDIASEAGCTTGVVTYYFRNKREVLVAALRRVHIAAMGRIRQRIEGTAGVSALRLVLVAVLPIDTERRLENTVWMNYWSKAMSDAQMATEQLKYYQEWKELIRTCLLEAADLGELHDGIDLDIEVDRLVGLIDGIVIQTGLEPTGTTASRMTEIMDVHLDGLLCLSGTRTPAARRLPRKATSRPG